MENKSEIILNEQAISALRESAKWSMFLAIIGFIGIGFMILAALFMTSAMSMIPDGNQGLGASPFGAIKGFISVFYILMAVVYFFPIMYLYKYASGMKMALNNYNSDAVSDALVQLKSHHKFLGITMIVIFSLYLLIIIGAVITGIFFATSAM
jgi:hypothetical protein